MCHVQKASTKTENKLSVSQLSPHCMTRCQGDSHHYNPHSCQGSSVWAVCRPITMMPLLHSSIPGMSHCSFIKISSSKGGPIAVANFVALGNRPCSIGLDEYKANLNNQSKYKLHLSNLDNPTVLPNSAIVGVA